MPNRRFNKQVPGFGYKSGGQVNTSRMNRLEELGRVDAERGRSRKGIKNLRDEKKRIVRELMGRKVKGRTKYK
jgi:hypothetical protein